MVICGLKGSVDILRMSTPTSSMAPHQSGGDMIESEALTWNPKVANAILAQVQGTCLDESRESSQLIQ